MTARRDTLTGVALVVLYTGAISIADAITKKIAGGFEAPQLFALSGLAVAGLCLLVSRPAGHVPKTLYPVATLLRSVCGVVGSVAFFLSFRHLPMAEVF
ncbi:MAG: EamA/RhaT family transporter, partial [Shimia sp.]|nr:EamA/RhaT family transporter [Shimia sp.]